MNGNKFYDVKGSYVVDGRITNIEGMAGIVSGAVIAILEDGNPALGQITMVGELTEGDAGHQLACVIPSSRGQRYGAIAQRKDGEKGLEGKYEGLVFLLNDAPSLQFPVVGKIGIHLKLSPPEQGIDN